ncbi:helix-turn-helix domain-containing protein [Bacillus norwichensis]|nr:helix-turn-helix domain-containing protein [Bacillus norwichensis]
MENNYHFGHLAEYATFNSVEELNHHVNGFRDKTTATEFKVLWFISKYAVKFIGAAHLKLATIADGIGMSIKTVQRAIKSLTEMEAIKKAKTTRPIKGGQGANIYQILPSYDLDVQAQMSNRKSGEKPHYDNVQQGISENQTASSLSSKSSSLNKRNDGPANANFVAHWVPERFASLVSYFYKDASTIQEFWKVIKQCNRVVDFFTGDRAFNSDQELTIGIRAIKEFVMKVKAGVRMNNKFGYFNGIVNNLMDKLYFDREFMSEW